VELLAAIKSYSVKRASKIIVIDDNLTALLESKTYLIDLLTKVVSHSNILLFLLLQSVFLLPRVARVNCQFQLILPSPADQLSLQNLGRQLYPNNPGFFVESVNHMIGSQDYGYALVDVHPLTPPELRLRTDIFHEFPTIYVPTKTRQR
jgi:hypothetical protein